MARLEQQFGVNMIARGNSVELQGAELDVAAAAQALDDLYVRAQGGHEIDAQAVDAAVRMVRGGAEAKDGGFRGEDVALKTDRRVITPRSPNQAEYLRALSAADLVFGLGPAGTGKTYLAVAAGVALLKQRKIERLILSRPAVEAGEKIGFLPGDIKEKVDPYLRPLYDALQDTMEARRLQRCMDEGTIEIAPLAFMRGRTLAHAYVILDEAQNATSAQMKMFLTRLGEGSKMAVTGDPSQVDLPQGATSGLAEAARLLGGIKNVQVCRFTLEDVVRHPLVSAILRAYDAAPTSKGRA